MRELAHIQLRGNDADFSAEWHERIDVEYSDDELRACELLQITVIGNGGEGGNEYKRAYELRPLQPGCGLSEYMQIADLTINSEEFAAVPESKARRRCDLFRTRFGEIIVSRTFREIVRSLDVPRVRFRGLYDTANGGKASDTYFQLVAEAQIGLFLPPSPVERVGFRPECGAYESIVMTRLPRSLGSEFYFDRKTYNGESLTRSREKLGKLPQQTPLLFISGGFHIALETAAIFGYWAQPAHLVDTLGI